MEHTPIMSVIGNKVKHLFFNLKSVPLWDGNEMDSETSMPQKETTAAAPPEKKRYEWIDNARLVAALLIIYVHMQWFFPHEPIVTNALARSLVVNTTYYGMVPFFFILAGYLLARQITWHKALDRALWLLIPYVTWNCLYYVWTHLFTHTLGHFFTDLPWIIGIGPFFSRNTVLFAEYSGSPYIPVTWFLRDIILLSLLTPIFARYRSIIKYILIIVFCALPAKYAPPSDQFAMLSPGYCAYYLLGVCLVDYRISDAYRILNKKFTILLVLGVLISVALSFYTSSHGLPSFVAPMIGCVFGALMIAQCGILIEMYLPRFSKWLAPCGPACFLVFVLHAPIFQMIAWLLPQWITGTALVWLLPIPVCALIIAIFLLMKRFTPWLLPYLGHMKMPKQTAR